MTRIIPDLQCSLLCEEVRQEANGNPMLIGVFTQLAVPQLPVTAFKIVCFNRWTCGVGEFTENVKLIAQDGSTALCENKMKWGLKRPEDILTNVHVFGNVEFKESATRSFYDSHSEPTAELTGFEKCMVPQEFPKPVHSRNSLLFRSQKRTLFGNSLHPCGGHCRRGVGPRI